MLIAGFPAGSFATNCYVVAASGPGEECVIIDPGQDAEPGIDASPRRVPAQAGGGAAHPRPHRPHLVGGAGLRRPRHPGLHPPGRPGAAVRPGPRAVPPGAGQQLLPRADLHRARRRGRTGRRHDAAAGRRGNRGRPRTRAHPRVGDLPDRPGGVLFSGDLLFARSIGRTDLPGGDYPTILDSLARVCLPLPDETAGAARPRAADHHRRRARQQPVPGRPHSQAVPAVRAGRPPGRRGQACDEERLISDDPTHGRDPAPGPGRRAGDPGRLGRAAARPRRRGLHRPARRQRRGAGRVPRRGREPPRARAAGRVLHPGDRRGPRAAGRQREPSSCPPARSR